MQNPPNIIFYKKYLQEAFPLKAVCLPSNSNVVKKEQRRTTYMTTTNNKIKSSEAKNENPASDGE